MPDRDLVVVALPHGRRGKTGLLSILFAPRLMTTTRLDNYPDWRDWPAARSLFGYQVKLNGTAVPGNQVVEVSPAPSSAAWRAAFPGTTRVRAWKRVDRSGVDIKSFGETAFVQHTLALYLDIARRFPATPPTVGELGLGALSDQIQEAQDYLLPTGDQGDPRVPDHTSSHRTRGS